MRLDTLTKEENLMTAARTFEATHDINVNVKATDKKVTAIEEVLQHVDGNIRVTQELTYDVHADVGVIKEGARSVDDNVKVTKRGTPIVSVSCNVTGFSYSKSAIDEIQRLLLPDAAIIDDRV
jgi:hypothetical protein